MDQHEEEQMPPRDESPSGGTLPPEESPGWNNFEYIERFLPRNFDTEKF